MDAIFGKKKKKFLHIYRKSEMHFLSFFNLFFSNSGGGLMHPSILAIFRTHFLAKKKKKSKPQNMKQNVS
jgi:hypothetical protein